MDKQLIYKVCHMYYIEKLTQQVIGDRLGISRMKVARLIYEAQEQGFIEIKLNFDFQEQAKLSIEVESRFAVKVCSVVPTYENINHILSDMAIALGKILERCLADEMFIGISWGTTLEGMAKYLKLQKKYDVTIIPIVGAVGLEGEGSYTNYVTKSFADKIGGKNFTINVPAVVNSEVEKNVMEQVKDTQKIINLTKKVDIALVGMSDATIGSSLGQTGNFQKDEIDYLQNLGVIGNVNLVFLDTEGMYVKNRVENRIVRIIDPQVLKKVPIRIGIAFGKSKVEVIAAAMHGGWINHLVTDQDTAMMLLNKEREK